MLSDENGIEEGEAYIEFGLGYRARIGEDTIFLGWQSTGHHNAEGAH